MPLWFLRGDGTLRLFADSVVHETQFLGGAGMIFRQFRKCGFWLVSGLVVITGDVSHLLAADFAASRPGRPSERAEADRKAIASNRTVEVIDSFGNVVTLPVTWSSEPAKLFSPAELKKLKQDLIARTFGADARGAKIAARQLKLMDVVEAKTPAGRHAAVARLGVQTFETPAADGRTGTMRTFAVNGKPRLRIFVPPSRTISHESKSNPDLEVGGPAVPNEWTGRWKVASGCYWDPYDDGPDQCSPNAGRWKVGSEGCYFDDNDNGPDQCEPALVADGSGDLDGFECDGGADCATQEQFDDLYAAIAYGEDEAEAMQTAYDEAQGIWCSQNPGECLADQVQPMPGPSDGFSCLGEKLGFLSGIYGTTGAVGVAIVLVADPPATLAGTALVLAVIAIMSAVMGTWSAYYTLKACLGYLPLNPLLVYNRPTLAI